MSKELVLKDRSAAPGGLVAPRVTTDEVLARLRRGEPIVFVDARREAEWKNAVDMLPGALRLAPERPSDPLPLIPPGQAVVTYCTCAHEASAAKVAELLIERGFEDVHPLHGGLQAWREAGGPLDPK